MVTNDKMKHIVIGKTFNKFFTKPSKIAKVITKRVKKKIKRFGKFWNQVPPIPPSHH